MKKRINNAKEAAPAPVFPTVIRQRGAKAATPGLKPEKRDNVFSKSRDTREDRSARQMKTARASQTLRH